MRERRIGLTLRTGFDTLRLPGPNGEFGRNAGLARSGVRFSREIRH